jgi:hypothetical protein
MLRTFQWDHSPKKKRNGMSILDIVSMLVKINFKNLPIQESMRQESIRLEG